MLPLYSIALSISFASFCFQLSPFIFTRYSLVDILFRHAFLALVNASGISSALHLQNTWSIADPKQQAIPLALALGRELLDGTGAIRVHGGGFAGTIQAFVPVEKLSAFRSGMEAVLGSGTCHILHIRPVGGCVVVA